MLGLVTTKRPELETKDELKRRIEEAARYAPLGPARAVAAMRLLEHDARATRSRVDDEIEKLRLVVEVAREVWG